MWSLPVLVLPTAPGFLTSANNVTQNQWGQRLQRQHDISRVTLWRFQFTAMLFIEILPRICEITASNCSANCQCVNFKGEFSFLSVIRYSDDPRQYFGIQIAAPYLQYNPKTLGTTTADKMATEFEDKLSFFCLIQAATAQQMYSHGLNFCGLFEPLHYSWVNFQISEQDKWSIQEKKFKLNCSIWNMHLHFYLLSNVKYRVWPSLPLVIALEFQRYRGEQSAREVQIKL